MHLRSLQWRLVSFFCLITLCLIIPIWLYLNYKVEDSYYSMFEKKIEEGFKKWDIKNDPSQKELEESLEGNLQLFSANLDNRSFTITDRNGRILDTNEPDFIGKEDSSTNELLESDNYVQALANKDNNKKILEKYGDEEFFDYAKRVGNYIIYFRYDKKDWADVLTNINGIIITSILIAIVIAFVIGYMLSRTITSPIAKLMNKARSIADGDFDQVLEVQSNDEIGMLTETFNDMASSLKKTLTEISSEKNKMETIFNYMTDGVIAFNLMGEVIHTNPASSVILGEEKALSTFGDYAEKYGFSYSIEDVLYLQSRKTREISIDIAGRIVRIYFAVFTDEAGNPEGIIAVLQDITEQQRLENMRKEFVANVSHELRTPLTSIKSYTETLLDGAVEDREAAEKFLGVINNEADRMTRLVKDLLQLSRLDNQQLQWHMEEINFSSLVKSAVERMELEAKNKHQTLECFTMGEIPDIMADYGRMEQVVFNLLSNSIKYTPEGGKVTVYLGSMYNEVYMKVADTGIGIPEHDLPRIFERFYRVDKARSREMGGTGLGLAIAKEIIEAHTGVITITSEQNKGTEVTVRLPISGKGGNLRETEPFHVI